MPILIGFLVGGGLGLLTGEGGAALGGALIGALVGLIVRVLRKRAPVPTATPDVELVRRVALLEARVQGLEMALLRVLGEAPPEASRGPYDQPVPPSAAAARAPASHVEVPVATPATSALAPPPASPAASAPTPSPPRDVPPPMPAYGAARGPAPLAASRADAGAEAPISDAEPASARPPVAPPPVPPAVASPLWRWITGGNVLARVGALVLFIGVAFLAKYATERVTVPIELRLAGIVLLAIGLLVVGWRLRVARRGYAMTLQGAAIAVLYLTVFAALALYHLLPPVAAFALLAFIAAATAVLAVRQDAMALAVLAALGGFAAPVLTSSGSGSHVMLFAYYAVLNAGLFAIAWFRPWRVLNLVGFACTFIVATAWGVTRYRPEQFATTEPFLVLFFLFYVGIAVAYALHRSLSLRDPVDGALVFGTPLVVAALQAALVRPFELGMAFSAVAMAALYLGLAMLLHRARGATLRPLVESFVALGLVFATLAIPLAFDARWTSAAWALEGAALVWTGLRRERLLMRVAGLLLQVGAAVAFALHLDLPFGHAAAAVTGFPFLNSAFVGAVLIALAGGFSAWRYSVDAARARPGEALAAPVLLTWALLWWLGAGVHEIERFFRVDRRVAAVVAWLALTAALLLAAARGLRWSMPRAPTVAYVPALLALAVGQGVPRLVDGGHLLDGTSALSWVVALAVAVLVLHVLERERHDTGGGPLGGVHAVLLWLLTFIVAEEAAWAIGLVTDGEAWTIAALAIPPAAVVLLLTGKPPAWWPVGPWAASYRRLGAGGLVAVMLAGALVANGLSDGSAHPLPFVPLVNPLDIAFGAIALAAIAWWRSAGRAALGPDVAGPAAVLAGVAAWLWLSMSTARVVHHATGMPFAVSAFWASATLQAALALVWSVAALAVMVLANRRGARFAWAAGAALLGLVVVKLFLVDLAQAGTVARIVSFIGVGLLLLLIGYLAPVPPRRAEAAA